MSKTPPILLRITAGTQNFGCIGTSQYYYFNQLKQNFSIYQAIDKLGKLLSVPKLTYLEKGKSSRNLRFLPALIQLGLLPLNVLLKTTQLYSVQLMYSPWFFCNKKIPFSSAQVLFASCLCVLKKPFEKTNDPLLIALQREQGHTTLKLIQSFCETSEHFGFYNPTTRSKYKRVNSKYKRVNSKHKRAKSKPRLNKSRNTRLLSIMSFSHQRKHKCKQLYPISSEFLKRYPTTEAAFRKNLFGITDVCSFALVQSLIDILKTQFSLNVCNRMPKTERLWSTIRIDKWKILYNIAKPSRDNFVLLTCLRQLTNTHVIVNKRGYYLKKPFIHNSLSQQNAFEMFSACSKSKHTLNANTAHESESANLCLHKRIQVQTNNYVQYSDFTQQIEALNRMDHNKNHPNGMLGLVANKHLSLRQAHLLPSINPKCFINQTFNAPTGCHNFYLVRSRLEKSQFNFRQHILHKRSYKLYDPAHSRSQFTVNAGFQNVVTFELLGGSEYETECLVTPVSEKQPHDLAQHERSTLLSIRL